ncbi:MAG: YjjW family glycine radical enzyme activase [Spirochaetaceae bacterium]|nr:YjjW family glycine radical enzyme activase [Spirochaetaceae bacterium]
MSGNGGKNSAPVNRILKSSIVDGPGNRAAVFVQGCNFTCRYCHNSETISLCRGCGDCVTVCPAGALRAVPGKTPPFLATPFLAPPLWDEKRCVLCDACIKICPFLSSPRVRMMDPPAVMAELESALPFVRGITVSGGECTRYPAFLQGLGRLARERGLTFFLDSNGSYPWEADEALLACIDAVMLDIKADPDNPVEYGAVTGNSGETIRRAAEFLVRRHKLYEVRTVISPGLFDARNTVEKVCRLIAGAEHGPAEIRYKLIRYRSVGVRPSEAAELRSPDDALMEELAAVCASYGIKAMII